MILCVAFLLCASLTTQAITCPDNVCTKIKCKSLEDCNERNGIIRKKAGFCECCDACVIQIAKGDICTPPLLGVPMESECSKGLYCNPKTFICEKKP